MNSTDAHNLDDDFDDDHDLSGDNTDNKLEEIAVASDGLRKQFNGTPLQSPKQRYEANRQADVDDAINATFKIASKSLQLVAKIIIAYGRKKVDQTLELLLLDDRVLITVKNRQTAARHPQTVFVTSARLAERAGTSTGKRFGVGVQHLLGLDEHFDGILRCALSDKGYLVVKSRKTELRLGTLPVVTDLKIGPITADAPTDNEGAIVFNATTLRRGLEYVAKVSRLNAVSPQMSTIEIENGIGRGGTVKAVAVFESMAITGVRMKIERRDLKGTIQLLSCFGQPHLSETDEHYLIRDELFSVAVPKSSHLFPAVNRALETEPCERFAVRAGQFENVLSCFQPLAAKRADDVHLRLELDIEYLQLTARIPNRPKNFGSARLTIPTEDRSTRKPMANRITVDHRVLKKMIAVGDPNRLLDVEVSPRQIILRDQVEGLTMRAIIAIIK